MGRSGGAEEQAAGAHFRKYPLDFPVECAGSVEQQVGVDCGGADKGNAGGAHGQGKRISKHLQ